MISEFNIDLPAEMLCSAFPEQEEHACIPVQSASEPLPSGTLRWNDVKQVETVVHQVACPVHQRAVHSDWTFMAMENCTQPCSPMHHDERQVLWIRLVVGSFAALTMAVSIFAIVIFMRQNERYGKIFMRKTTFNFRRLYFLTIGILAIV